MKKQHSGLTVWLTGLSGAGKTTISTQVAKQLIDLDYKVECLDGDLIRQTLTKGLGFSKIDRDENIRRIGFVANLLTRNEVIVLVSVISPYQEIRQEVRTKIGNFMEVYVSASLAVCQQRDVKGHYQKAQAGELKNFTGVADPYEPPLHPELICHTDSETIAESVDKVVQAILVTLKI